MTPPLPVLRLPPGRALSALAWRQVGRTAGVAYAAGGEQGARARRQTPGVRQQSSGVAQRCLLLQSWQLEPPVACRRTRVLGLQLQQRAQRSVRDEEPLWPSRGRAEAASRRGFVSTRGWQLSGLKSTSVSAGLTVRCVARAGALWRVLPGLHIEQLVVLSEATRARTGMRALDQPKRRRRWRNPQHPNAPAASPEATHRWRASLGQQIADCWQRTQL